jgi:phosphoglucomutase/phosphomannomutase
MTGLYDDDAVGQAVQKVRVAAAEGRISRGGADNLTRWLSEPQYARYVPRLLEMITAERFEELDSLFWEVIPFGTGGRRGLMHELGSATINERTIAESADGLARYLKQVRSAPGGRAVIAHDTRNRSAEFARLAATTLAAHGLTVFFFDSHRATPELSFAVRHLKCDVGAMISASHNPPSDNGIKAYWSTGAQVLPPHDKGIIDCVYQAKSIPAVDFDQAVAESRICVVGHQVDRA